MSWWKFYSPSFGILGGFVMTTEMLPTRARIDVIQSATLSSSISKSCWKLGHRTGLATTKVGHHLDSDAHLPPTQPDGNDEWTTTEWMQSVLLVQSGGEIIVEGKVWMNLLVGVRWWKSYRKMKTGESGRREWSCEASMYGWCQGYLGFSIFNRIPPWQPTILWKFHFLCILLADFPTEYRRLQGLLPRRFTEIRLGFDGGVEEAVPDFISDEKTRVARLAAECSVTLEKELKNFIFRSKLDLSRRRQRREWNWRNVINDLYLK